jgi:hypothetical protein
LVFLIREAAAQSDTMVRRVAEVTRQLRQATAEAASLRQHLRETAQTFVPRLEEQQPHGGDSEGALPDDGARRCALQTEVDTLREENTMLMRRYAASVTAQARRHGAGGPSAAAPFRVNDKDAAPASRFTMADVLSLGDGGGPQTAATRHTTTQSWSGRIPHNGQSPHHTANAPAAQCVAELLQALAVVDPAVDQDATAIFARLVLQGMYPVEQQTPTVMVAPVGLHVVGAPTASGGSALGPGRLLEDVALTVLYDIRRPISLALPPDGDLEVLAHTMTEHDYERL